MSARATLRLRYAVFAHACVVLASCGLIRPSFMARAILCSASSSSAGPATSGSSIWTGLELGSTRSRISLAFSADDRRFPGGPREHGPSILVGRRHERQDAVVARQSPSL